MGKRMFNFAKAMGLGLAVGCMAGAVANQYMHSGKRGVKKTVNRAMKNLSDLAEDLGEMF